MEMWLAELSKIEAEVDIICGSTRQNIGKLIHGGRARQGWQKRGAPKRGDVRGGEGAARFSSHRAS